jgi:probable F420-dependent oxidoreductase
MPVPDRPLARWRDRLHRIEDLGFDAVSVSEHLTGGWVMEALTAMTAIVEVTTRLRVLSLALNNDLRHPVLLHKAAATIDLVSDGRLELGLGAGWLERDYAAAGIRFDPPGVRIERLEESIRIIKGLFGPSPFSFAGRHYQVAALEGLPRPTQLPHPPILIGGGGERILGLAAREADIIGVHARLDATTIGQEAARDLGEAAVAAKVSLVRDALVAAGRSTEDVELQFTIYDCRITDGARLPVRGGTGFARFLAADPELYRGSPAVLVGSLGACTDRLVELRERFGLSYFKLSGDPETTAPIVARLAGR